MYQQLKKLYHRLFPNYRSYTSDIRYFTAQGKILDVGCGQGHFIAADPDRITGIDANPHTVREAVEKGLNVIECSALSMPFENHSFDGVYCSHLIEHLLPDDAYKLLEEINRVLKPGGILVLKAPLLTKHFYNDPTHIKPYPPNAIINMLTGNDTCQPTINPVRCKFEVISVKWDYARLYHFSIPPSVNVKKYWWRALLHGISLLLNKFGISKPVREGFTMVMKKSV